MNVTEAVGPAQVRREDQARVIPVYADVVEGGLDQGIVLIGDALQDLVPSRDVRWEVGGENEEMRRSFRDLAFAFGLALILVYSLSVFGMVLIPGADANGDPVRVNFLDAAYFVAIMATTIGFGEIPATFTQMQRLRLFVTGWGTRDSLRRAVGRSSCVGSSLRPTYRAICVLKRSATTTVRISQSSSAMPSTSEMPRFPGWRDFQPGPTGTSS